MHALQAFWYYYETNVAGLVIFARRFIPVDMAEDIVHDVFLEIWEHIDSLDTLPSRSYLFMAVKNKCLNYLKKEEVKASYLSHIQRENKRLELEYYDSFEKLLIDQQSLHEVYRQIELLPEKCRQIVQLAYFKEKKNAEIAELLGLSIRTVEHQLYLGLKRLREKLQQRKRSRKFFFIFF